MQTALVLFQEFQEFQEFAVPEEHSGVRKPVNFWTVNFWNY
jgi:hypothetical protein